MQAIKDFKHLKKYTQLVENKLFSDLWEMIYKPMFKILNLKAENEKDVILEAIKSGKLYLTPEGFKAKDGFDNELSKALIKLGAKYDRYFQTFRLEEIPENILKAIEASKKRAATKLNQINDFLADVQYNLQHIIETMVFNTEVVTILDDVHGQIKKNITKLNVIEPEFTEEQKKQIAENYTNNMQFYIKNWAEKDISAMREKVQKAVLDGYREDEVQEMLEKEYKIASDKAKFLAQNETSIMLAEVKKQTYTQMGFEYFIWNTILDGKERELHADLHGKIFRFDEPPIIYTYKGVEQRGLPGQTYNCLTGDMQITTPFLHNRIFKRKFRGEAVEIITSMGRIKLTPNHPVLTDKGWVKASSLNIGDNIAKISDESILACGSNPNNTKTTIDEFYSFYSILFDEERVALTDNDFHGDVSVDKQVNTINIKAKLRNYTKPYISQLRVEQVLTEANELFSSVDASSNRAFLQAFPFSRAVTDCFIGSLDKAFAFFFGSESHPIEHTLRAISWLDSLLFEVTGYNTTRNTEYLSELFNTTPRSIKFYQLILWNLADTMVNWKMTEFSHTQREMFSLNAESLSNIFDSIPSFIEFDTITDKIVSVFDGHIFNLENKNNWYLTQYYITKNCRCTLIPVNLDSPFFDAGDIKKYRELKNYKGIMKTVA